MAALQTHERQRTELRTRRAAIDAEPAAAFIDRVAVRRHVYVDDGVSGAVDLSKLRADQRNVSHGVPPKKQKGTPAMEGHRVAGLEPR